MAEDQQCETAGICHSACSRLGVSPPARHDTAVRCCHVIRHCSPSPPAPRAPSCWTPAETICFQSLSNSETDSAISSSITPPSLLLPTRSFLNSLPLIFPCQPSTVCQQASEHQQDIRASWRNPGNHPSWSPAPRLHPSKWQQ